ncbi:MAG: hypothetical protein EDS66_04195 [Planctomycetota bacterium]|nr:MAG: hypothetical protein EDS66_04195 [Planctomycetota bacterium]KAB2941155.1 MAG: menaquinone biosynthesis protein [Phycisphaerae bacterium]MCQ3920651.1 hypothetical protein [Planctomycetota bacterium]
MPQHVLRIRESVVVTSWRLGVVSFLNARPLICGLDADPRVTLRPDVPSRLAGLLDAGEVDAALVPIIDLLTHERAWRIISDACIGCDGETLTVRVFSKVPPERITRLHVDGDSHTSVALARLIWRTVHGVDLDIVPWEGDATAQAALLIGDKVVTRRPSAFDIETDLGAAWKSMTGLPFVFAVWAAPVGLDAGPLAAILSAARDAGVAQADQIAERFGPHAGWPVAVARRYLTRRLRFTLTPRAREGMTRFLELAKSCAIVDPHRDLIFA